MPNAANTSPGTTEPAGKKSLKDRAVTELEKYAVIAAYLWVLFALFGLHRQLVQGHGVSAWQQGFAIINALVFGKVMLIGEAFELGKARSSQALAWVVLRKSLIFALLLIAFHIAEAGPARRGAPIYPDEEILSHQLVVEGSQQGTCMRLPALILNVEL